MQHLQEDIHKIQLHWDVITGAQRTPMKRSKSNPKFLVIIIFVSVHVTTFHPLFTTYAFD